MGIRRKGRELAFQLLYEIELGKKDADEEFKLFQKNCREKEAARNFAFSLLKGTYENIRCIDEMLKECSSNWLLTRMTPVDRNIMRVAAYELAYSDTPPAVAIDEAIEISRKYGTEKSSKFVNGVLDCIRKKRERG